VVVVHDGPTGLWISRRNGARVNVLTRGVLRVPLRVVAVRVLPGIASGPSPEEASGSPSVVSRRPQKSGAGRRVAAPGPRSDDGLGVSSEVRFGDPATVALDAVQGWGAEAIAVVDIPTRGARRWLTRSVVDAIVEKSPVPVLVARASGQRAA